LTEDFEFVFSNIDPNPDELHPLPGWSAEELIPCLRSEYREKAAQWVDEAENFGRVAKRKRPWNWE
jgi:hypothetical protein